MATVTGFTAARMLVIENTTVVDGEVQGDNLILLTREGTPIDAGSVRGPKGDKGDVGPASVHPGIISMFGGNTAPAGYLLCDGSAVSRTTYAALFAEISTNWGVGDGANTFNLPNLQQKFPVGKGTEAWADTLNDTGGSKDAVTLQHNHAITHTHNTANHQHGFDHGHTASAVAVDINHTHNIPEHYHAMQQAGEHGHGLGDGTTIWYYGPSGMGGVGGSGIAPSGGYITTGGAGGQHSHYIFPQTPGPSGYMAANNVHGHTVNIGAASGTATTAAGAQALTHTGNTPDIAGAGPGTDKNLPPYVVVNFIIKT